MNTKIILILTFTLNVSECFSDDLDLDDYNLTMAQEELKKGNSSKAKSHLEDVEINKKKADLLQEAESLEQHQKQKAYAEKKQQEVEQRKRQEALARQRDEEKKILEDARPELLRRTECDCLKLKSSLGAELIHEKSAAEYSGLVNKQKVYNIGQSLHRLDLKLSKLYKEMQMKNVTASKCENYKDEQGYLCSSY